MHMQDRWLARIARRMFHRPGARQSLVMMVATLMLFAGLPRAASADALLNGECVQSQTGGSYVCADLYERSSDGAGQYFTTPARTWQHYQTVWIVAFDDGDGGYTISHVLASWID